MAGTVAEHWWQYETNWEEEIVVMPEIVVPVEEESVSDNEEPFVSVSRRSSLYTLTPYMPNRRNSMESVASSGYGSVWSGPARRRRSPESQRSSDSDE